MFRPDQNLTARRPVLQVTKPRLCKAGGHPGTPEPPLCESGGHWCRAGERPVPDELPHTVVSLGRACARLQASLCAKAQSKGHRQVCKVSCTLGAGFQSAAGKRELGRFSPYTPASGPRNWTRSPGGTTLPADHVSQSKAASSRDPLPVWHKQQQRWNAPPKRPLAGFGALVRVTEPVYSPEKTESRPLEWGLWPKVPKDETDSHQHRRWPDSPASLQNRSHMVALGKHLSLASQQDFHVG